MTRKTYNERLPPLPDDREVIAAVIDLEDNPTGLTKNGASAQSIAWKLGIVGASRLGRGARGPQSWSGTMVPGLRIAPRLRSLEHRGLLVSVLVDYRHMWWATEDGRKFVA